MVTNSIEPGTLEQRIAKLEDRFNEDKRSLLKRFSVWGGLVALVVSILIGGIQIYDFTVLRKMETLEAKKIQLHGYIRRLSELNTSLSNMLSAKSPQDYAKSYINVRPIISQKYIVVRLADTLLQEYPETGGFDEYLTLSLENLSLRNASTALIYAQNALMKSTNNLENIEAMRGIAGAQFALGGSQDIEAARKTFLDAINDGKKEKLWNPVANSLSDLVISESYLGECEKAKEALFDLKKSLTDANEMFLLSAVLQDINYRLSGDAKCPHLLKH